jgi:long-chain acyl-CoA synthetase
VQAERIPQQETDPQELKTRPWARNYPEGVRQHLEYPLIPLTGLLDEAVRTHPDHTAIVFVGARTSYRQLGERVARLATFLSRLGVKKGDRVCIMLPNVPQFVVSYYGVLRVGGTVAAANPMYVERELEYLLNDSGARVMIVLDLFYPRVKKVREKVPLDHVIVTSVADALRFPLNALYPLKARREGHAVEVDWGPTVHRWREAMAAPPHPPQVEVDPRRDVAVLQYTGGTTGIPKAAMLTHYNMVANALQTAEWLPRSERGSERCLSVLPLFHAYGMTTAMNLPVARAYTMILLPRWVTRDVLETIHREKPTLFPGAPTMYVAINNFPEVKKYELSSIKACISGSAPLPLEVQEKFEALTGARLVEGYGLSESSPVTHCNPIYGMRKVGSIGIPFPDTDCCILDLETGERPLPAGEVGELAIRGPQVMLGYWNRPEETRATLKDGWLRTGDVARMDEDGFFYIVDRKKDLIVAGGYNIYPREVEEVLYMHPKVKEVAVVGVPDPYRGETVKAFIVLKEGGQATAEEIEAFCRQHLAAYKVPRLVEFRSELPKTIVGKVLRRLLVEEEKQKQKSQPEG